MKTLLQINNIHKAYGAQVILDDANVTILEDRKIGVIGRNGAGKSTLCKIIIGQEQQDSGTIQKTPDLRLAYLEQHDPYKMDETVSAFLMRYAEKEEWECGKVAARFQLKNEILDAQIGTLPGGFRTRVKLAAMLLRDPNLLILDEPTNYLDLRTLILLEEFLMDFDGGFMIVSHDREFLKKTCTQTLEIENGACTLYPGTVEEFLLFKEEQARLTDSYNKGILAKKKHLQTFIDRFGATASKAGQARSMMKKIEKLKTIDTGHSLGNVHLKIPQVEKKNLAAFRCDDLSIGYPDRQVAARINMEFNQGDHIAILGDNGQGKTTFMRTIVGDLKALSGTYKWSYGLSIGYYAQHVLLMLDQNSDVLTHLVNKADKSVTRQEILDLAGSFLFKGDDVLKKISVLSGGEKARLCLAGLLLAKNNALLLDEPTNHLDFETTEALGEALKKFNGTVFFISHDRTFVNMLATQIVEVNNGTVLRYPGSYEEYVYSMEAKVREDLRDDKPAKPKHAAPHPVVHKEHHPHPVKHHKVDKAQLRVEKAKIRTERSHVEAELRKVHANLDRHKKEREEIHQMFAKDPASWSSERNSRFEYLERVIPQEEDKWLELTEKVDHLSKKHDAL